MTTEVQLPNRHATLRVRAAAQGHQRRGRYFRRLDHVAGGHRRLHRRQPPRQGAHGDGRGQRLLVQGAGVRERRRELLRRGGKGRLDLDHGERRGLCRARSALANTGEVVKVTEAVLTYVAVDENRQKRPVPPA